MRAQPEALQQVRIRSSGVQPVVIGPGDVSPGVSGVFWRPANPTPYWVRIHLSGAESVIVSGKSVTVSLKMTVWAPNPRRSLPCVMVQDSYRGISQHNTCCGTGKREKRGFWICPRDWMRCVSRAAGPGISGKSRSYPHVNRRIPPRSPDPKESGRGQDVNRIVMYSGTRGLFSTEEV